jgi:FHS family glucose/mannose:H+ symporter-like MFS transporter
MMAAVCIFLFSRVKIEHHDEKEKSKQNDYRFFANPYFYIFISLMFLYVGAEIAINGWIVTFLNDSQIVSNSASNYVLTILWILVIIGRYTNRHIKKSVTFETRLTVCSFLILISYIILINTSSVALLIVSVAVLGLAMSSYYPNTIANITERIKGNAAALGLAMSFGGLGGAVIPWVSGVIADGYGLKAAMQTVIVFICFLIIASVTNILLNKKV